MDASGLRPSNSWSHAHGAKADSGDNASCFFDCAGGNDASVRLVFALYLLIVVLGLLAAIAVSVT
jgi:hypothetical protein